MLNKETVFDNSKNNTKLNNYLHTNGGTTVVVAGEKGKAYLEMSIKLYGVPISVNGFPIFPNPMT